MDYRKVMSLDMEILTQLKNALVSTSCVSLGIPLEFISFPSKNIRSHSLILLMLADQRD